MDRFVARSPRHASTGVLVEVRRCPGGSANAVGAELINLSRDGFQLRLCSALEDEETVVMRICALERGVDVTFPATVRWQREEDGGWLAGCQTSWQLDLETLGELFLGEILVSGEPAGQTLLRWLGPSPGMAIGCADCRNLGLPGTSKGLSVSE